MPHLDLSSEIKIDSESFCGTALPYAASALYGNEELLEQMILTFEPSAQYECLLDAIAAWLVPGLRLRVIAFYGGLGLPLQRLWPAGRIEQVDFALSNAILACAEIRKEISRTNGDASSMRRLLREILRVH